MTYQKTIKTSCPVDSEFGKRIKQVRKSKKISVKALAEEVGTPVSNLMRIEYGQRQITSIKLLVKLSEALDIPKDELIMLATKRAYNAILDDQMCRATYVDYGNRTGERFAKTAGKLNIPEDDLWNRVGQTLLNFEATGKWDDDVKVK